uniref:Uncharacterized protein n=1 Tax=Clastoptera arizonana TaxID=38151 RepID=A0A1B6CZL7_9HEMI
MGIWSEIKKLCCWCRPQGMSFESEIDLVMKIMKEEERELILKWKSSQFATSNAISEEGEGRKNLPSNTVNIKRSFSKKTVNSQTELFQLKKCVSLNDLVLEKENSATKLIKYTVWHDLRNIEKECVSNILIKT